MWYIIKSDNAGVRISQSDELGPREELVGEESRKQDAVQYAQRIIEDECADRVSLLKQYYNE